MKALEATHAELMAAQQAEMAASGQLRLQLAEMEQLARDHDSAEVALRDSLEAAAEEQKQHMNMVRAHVMLHTLLSCGSFWLILCAAMRAAVCAAHSNVLMSMFVSLFESR